MTLTYADLTEPERALWEAMEAGTVVSLPLNGPVGAGSAVGSGEGGSAAR